jgi:hypothetical protein
MKTVSGRHLEVLQAGGEVHVLQFARRAGATSDGNRLAVPARYSS